ncbi:GPP34 family phosphoprotein [Anaeromicropila herbilytica]|uniref:GPP34 family phosphoprotein n=1 Tax=Anaeromicropila herbilytica TaxID=2785025 RepID=A0A7R7IE00_9FIRM|nr:GPP34 family phosphoprotein [Anaeromicropila herbilytica]BCN31476.1 GPP34 family phosphoprotein [Anaeromicropila herbilytica]
MNDLSIAQKYLLCSLKKKGAISAIQTEALTCVVSAGVIELILSKCAKMKEKKKIEIIGELDSSLKYLKSLYDHVNKKKEMSVNKIASDYVFSFTNKDIKGLMVDIAESLEASGYVSRAEAGIFRKKTVYIPVNEKVDAVINQVKNEVLGKAEMSDDTVAFVSLLDKSHQLKRFFSKDESEQLKVRLKEVKNTSSNNLVKQMVDYVDAIFIACTVH